jgi:sulfite reductase (NADPH) flavoprotein alpha-component
VAKKRLPKDISQDSVQRTMALGKNAAVLGRLIGRERLSGADSDKEICSLTISAEDDFAYEAGDWLAVIPQNDGGDVYALLQELGGNAAEAVPVRGSAEKLPLSEALKNFCTITQVPANLAAFFAERERNSQKKESLLSGLAGDAASFLCGHDLRSFLRHFVTDIPPLLEWVPLLKPLQPRMYSIASSPHVDKKIVKLLVTTATHADAAGNMRCGLASSYLNRRLRIGDFLRCYTVRSRFRLPEDPQTDVIMVGPGAGLAPFMGFLEERLWQRTAGMGAGRNWLFFGDRHRKSDFIFREKLMAYERNSLLTRLDLAFSRDQEKKIYVQDRILECGEELWNWLDGGAYFYICGNAKRMAKDVEEAAITALVCSRGVEREAAASQLKELQRTRRYQQDVY